MLQVIFFIGLPIEGIGLIMRVNRILDIFSTTVNAIEDCVCTLIVIKKENVLDETVYYSEIEEDEFQFAQES